MYFYDLFLCSNHETFSNRGSGGCRISPVRANYYYRPCTVMSGRYASYMNAFLFCNFFAENCMIMKEFGPRGGIPSAPLGSATERSRISSVSGSSLHYTLFRIHIQRYSGLVCGFLRAFFLCCKFW